MSEEEIIKIIRSKVSEETIFQLTQIKTFVDNSLKEVFCRSFEKEEDKIKYLIEILQNLRDFTVVITNEDAVRNNILRQLIQTSHEIKMGNELEQQEKNQSQNLEENQA